MIRRPPRSTQSRSSAASDVYKRQILIRSPTRRTGPARAVFHAIRLRHPHRVITALTTAEWAQLAGTAFTAIAVSAALLTVIRAERDRWDRRLPDFQVEPLRDMVADEARLTIVN